MTTCYFGPDPLQSTFFVPGGAVPATGAQLFTYLAGSSTKTTVYKDSAGNTAHTNPIVLDSGGNLPSGGVIWIPTGITIKAVWAPSNDTDPPASPYRTIDNLSGINDVSALLAPSEWVAGPTPTFVSATSFTLAGDQTSAFHAGRKLKMSVTAGTAYGAIKSAIYSSSTTIAVDTYGSNPVDSGLSAVSYGLLSAANFAQSATLDSVTRSASSIPAANTLNLDAVGADQVFITGTTQINSITLSQGHIRHAVFINAGLTIQNSSSLVMPSNANILTQVSDCATFKGEASGLVRCINYQPFIGLPTAYKVGTTTYSLSTASASFTINGIGFKGRCIDMYATASGQIGAASWGFADESNSQAVYDDGISSSATYNTTANLMLLQTGVGNFVSGGAVTFADGSVTITMTKTGTPVGTATLKYKVAR